MSKAILEYYKAIEESSVRMLNAAKTSDWAAMVQLEGVCAVLIEQLKHQAHVDQLDTSERAEKTRIMMRILGNDAEIRTLTEVWLDDIESQIPTQRGLLH